MRKILIVDDATFMLKAVSAMLSPKYECICASSGMEAMELYESDKPDMILTDLIMPQMTGLELQKALQEKYQDTIPMMFMTADERDENESRSLENGAMDYIRKPFTKDLLLRRVDNIMRQMDRIRDLKIVAETDPMTGLLNKAYAQKVLTDACRKNAGILMMVDLDSFKLVNDIFGHDMGDQILIHFSDLLRSAIRTTDIAGRMGGDEFIVFCQDIRDENVIAEKSRFINEYLLAAAKRLMGEDMNIPLGASIGAVRVPDEGTSFDVLYRKADKALYRVKQNGKHGYEFYEGDNAPEDADKDRADTTLENVRMILDERNRPKGAFEVGFENFRSIYRYQVRSIENYHGKVELVLFTVRCNEPGLSGSVIEEVSDLFSDVLRSSLRRSDVYTRSGKHQFMVLLSSMDNVDRSIILLRIIDNWKKATTESRHFSIDCNACTLEAKT